MPSSGPMVNIYIPAFVCHSGHPFVEGHLGGLGIWDYLGIPCRCDCEVEHR